ncbi:MAG: HD domain-containing protein [Patescibacteria group bacterium]
MDFELIGKLYGIRGCLSQTATNDSHARRRFSKVEDDDGAWEGLIRPFALDVIKLAGSKAIRRLPRKTQVVSLPTNAHTRDRGSHSLEVMACSALVADVMGLNSELIQAMALGHDIGHGPFGHYFEVYISKKTGKKFKHAVFSVVLAQRIEREGRGLNLTHQTLTGIASHAREAGLRAGGEMKLNRISPEADAVMYCDIIAYLFADYNDLFMRNSLTGSRLRLDEFPGLREHMDWFGANQRERTYRCLAELCVESSGRGQVSFRECEAAKRFAEARSLMYQAYATIKWERLEKMMDGVYDLLAELVPGADPAVMFALLTEADVEFLYRNMTRINANMEDCLSATALGDVVRHLSSDIDFTNPDLDW